jgi:threonine/homoserine/homoserine lactone efflux protein
MPDIVHWSTFFTATIIQLLIPGPSVMYVVTRGIEHGYRGVVLSSVGLALGDLLQVLCTVAGLAALLASSVLLVLLFGFVKYVGAAYLIVLGIHRFLATNATPLANFVITEHPGEQTSRSLVVQALVALNPKTAIFFLALFPQFVADNAGPAWLQILLFGCVFVVLGFVTNSMYGCLGGTLSSIAKHSNRFHIATRYISSAVLIGMGIAAALASAPHKPV